MSFGDLKSTESLQKLDAYLADNSFLQQNSLEVSNLDIEMFTQLSKNSIQILTTYPNILRWSKSVLNVSCKSCSNAVNTETQAKQDEIHNRPKHNKIEQKPKIPSLGKKLDPPPEYLAKRLKIWDDLVIKSNNYYEQKRNNDSKPITITLPNGNKIPGESWITTPYDIAKSISNSLAKNCIVAKLNKETLWDLFRPLEDSANIELLTFDNKEAKEVFWHSSAHVIGEAMEQYFGGKLVFGPPLDDGGFYYDIDSEYSITASDFPKIEQVVNEICKERQKFERLIVSKVDLLEMFEYNPYKQKVLNEKVLTEYTSAYRCGTLIDLCRGPHITDTSKIKAFKCIKTSSAYFEGKADQESLSRLYGISFPDKKLLKTWELFQEQAKQRDHRKIGKDQELFFFDISSPGTCFWYPKGAYIFNQLLTFMRGQYRVRGFKEVITPNMYDSELWKISGHWDHYSDCMFKLNEVEKKQFALKPMNCPGHCIMFKQRSRSFRELPLRFADFGVLHRNELAGALTGLTRVRRFQQDDAHIFTAPESIEDEISKCIDFLHFVIKVTLGMDYKLFLSTRPESYIGELEIWNDAEKQLINALNKYGAEFEIDEGGGAFYGPKIDIKVTDALNRSHQTATVQLDFNLPNRFNLKYIDSDGSEKRPVMIHRAILGSLERQMAIITEHFGGKWPLWLSPRMVKVITVNTKYNEYGQKVANTLYENGIEAELETDSGLTLNKKIRTAQLDQFNFQIIIGQTELDNESVNVRTRNNKQHGEYKFKDVLKKLVELKDSRSLKAEEEFTENMTKIEKVVKVVVNENLKNLKI